MDEKTFLNKLTHKINGLYKEQLVFAIIFGSRARDDAKENSDYDLMIVERSPMKDKRRIDDMRKFFIWLQEEHHLTVDYDYPGEYINKFALEKALKGYGFVYNINEIVIDKLGPHDWTKFNEYRQWLCSTAGPNIFLAGERDTFIQYKKQALETLMKLPICKRGFTFRAVEDVVDTLCVNGKEYLGEMNTPFTREYLKTEFTQILPKLEDAKIVSKNDENYTVKYDTCIKSLELLTSQENFELKKMFFGKEDLLRKEEVAGYINDAIDHINAAEKTIEYTTEEAIKDRFKDSLPVKSSPLEQVYREYSENIRKYDINQASNNYMAFPDSGNSIAGLIGSIAEAFTNQNLISTTKSAPTGTFVEIQIINWIRDLLGYTTPHAYPENAVDVGGMLVFGGVIANTIGILTAREKVFQYCRKKGLCAYKEKPILLVPGKTINHYSHSAAFGWLGLGEDNVIEVNVKPDYRMDEQDLENKLKKYANDPKYKVVAIIIQAGDSRTTTIEDFSKISDIAHKYNTWLHVDACHGGVLIFSTKYRGKLKGIEEADSISIDPHKGLWMTYPCSIILFKNVRDIQLLARHTDITINKGSYDSGQITPFIGSKPFIGLKLWFMIKNLGLKNIGKLVDYRTELATSWKNIIDSSRYFCSLNNVELNSVVFSVDPKKIDQLKTPEQTNKLNRFVHDDAYKEGFLCIHNFDIIDYADTLGFGNSEIRVLGTIFGNPLTDSSDFSSYISYLEQLVERYLE